MMALEVAHNSEHCNATVPLQGLAMHGATLLATSEPFEIEHLLAPGLNKMGETEISLFSSSLVKDGPRSKERLQAMPESSVSW